MFDMKKYIKLLSIALAAASSLTSCLEEVLPTDKATGAQAAESGIDALSAGMIAYLNNYSSDYYWDCGFMSYGVWRDASTSDMAIYNGGYDYFAYVGRCYSLGADATPLNAFRRYYYIAAKANLVISAAGDNVKAEDAPYVANAYAFRAWAYYEMSMWYEYFITGIPSLDDKAEQDGIMGLTAPIVPPDMTDAEARNNPRAPFYTMYRFIISDLNTAQELLNQYGQVAGNNNMLGKAGVNGLLARVWLALGSRFDLESPDNPDYLQIALDHENDADIPYPKLGITTAAECFSKAAAYAKAAQVGYTPLSESQWFDPQSGFNTSTNAWIWSQSIDSNNGLASSLTWQSFPSYMSPEAEYGVSTSTYNAYRCIDARMFSQIPDGDWRKLTWIDPADLEPVGDTDVEISANLEAIFDAKYARGTSMTFSEWRLYAPYTAFKFHPGSGNRSESTVGNVMSYPLMRVEEMYLIEAEAVGRSQSEAAGRALLEAFVNNYRWNGKTPYKSETPGIAGLIDDVFLQKRIELWGEGQVLWDYRRLQKPMTRGYEGTNWPDRYRFNSNANAVAPWSTASIPRSFKNANNAIILNPNPSYATAGYSEWSGE